MPGQQGKDVIRPLANERGIALVATLGVVAVLLVAAVQMVRLSGDSSLSASTQSNRFLAEQSALSGIHIGMAVLAMDAADNAVDSIREPWADPDELKAFAAALGLETQGLEIEITDEMGKIQINAQLSQFPGNSADAAQQALLERFITLMQAENQVPETRSNPVTLVDTVKDWLDSRDNDAVTGVDGAESDYYERLDDPYACANGPFNHIRDLYRVKGVDKARLPFELKKYFTVFGLDDKKNGLDRFAYSGKININTAPPEVLAALMPEGREDLAWDIADFREKKSADNDAYEGDLEPGWIGQVIELTQDQTAALNRKITYSSRFFNISCTVEKANTKVGLSAVVERLKRQGKSTCRILQLEQEWK